MNCLSGSPVEGPHINHAYGVLRVRDKPFCGHPVYVIHTKQLQIDIKNFQ